MINKEVTEAGRQVLGGFLCSERERKGISKNAVCAATGMTMAQVIAIETGSKAYTIDSLLAYVAGIDCYFNLSLPDREGKHLDHDDMVSKM
jgi:transcriptional regulator with XRE-family HTH domain